MSDLVSVVSVGKGCWRVGPAGVFHEGSRDPALGLGLWGRPMDT